MALNDEYNRDILINVYNKELYNSHQKMVVNDVQDRIDTVDQAGLYAILDYVSDKPIIDMGDSKLVEPSDLLKEPWAYRGKLLTTRAFIDPVIHNISLKRKTQKEIVLLNAQIPAGTAPDGSNLRIPTILLFNDLKNNSIVDRMQITGYFYMILRTKTKLPDPITQRKFLDYLVIIGQNLTEIDATAPQKNKNNNYLHLIGLLLFVILVWMILKNSMRKGNVKLTQPTANTARKTIMLNIFENFNGQTVAVELDQKSYPIYVGADVLDDFGVCFKSHISSNRAVIVTDENVGPLYGKALVDSLAAVGVKSDIITVPAGEHSKRLEIVESIYGKFFDFAVERSDAVIALGGGVVGDLSGFVAATFKRGCVFVQVPTSLLAMVDSSVGGKTGVNHPRGKNMIGAFYQPRFVYTDVAALKTLPDRQLGCGLAETVKHAVIRDGIFFEHLENVADEILGLQLESMVKLVVWNCKIKAEVVSIDEQESGLRRILNYGHTVGHTFETVLKDKDYHHGEAVSLGIIAANSIAQNRGLLKQSLTTRIAELLGKFNLPTAVDGALPIDDLYRAMLQDKKVKAGKIVFVLPTTVGNCTCVNDLTEEEIKNAARSLET
ncbi:MAG: 3-dehydroquinate synthase [Deltaproteobacteria bacterium]|nr:3-dehydroquinate synthase [Deltaproteobacteria bacterium]